MNNFTRYTIVWILLVALFNICCFVTPGEINGVSKYEGGFWPSYVFVMLAFVLHLVFAYSLFSEKNKEKLRQNTFLGAISFLELLLMVVVGALCMMIPSVSDWVAVIACFAVLAFSIIFLLSAKTVEEIKIAANSTLNSKTAYMRELADNAQELIRMAKTDDDRETATRIYEAIRYSDTVSSEEFRNEETAISDGLTSLEELIKKGSDKDTINGKADEILQLVEKRNNKAKALKRSL